jgi:hypothetical protein
MKYTAAAILSLLMAAVAAAQQAPVSGSVMDFSGGLNNYTASIYLNNNESPRLMNVVIDEPLGELRQRNGWQTCGHTPSGNTVTALFNYNKNNGAKYLIVSDNISVWQTDNCSDFTLIWTGLDTNSIPHFKTIYDNLWVVNGSTFPVVWNGSTASQLDGVAPRPLAPKAKYIEFWKSRVFLGNSAADPSAVYFSQLTDLKTGQVLDPATSTNAWSNTSNLIYFSRDDGSVLYGIKVYRDNLYSWKETGISRLVFESQYQLSVGKTVSVTGSKFQDSIQEMDDGFIRFLGRDGVYKFNGNVAQRISTKWTPTFYTFLQPSMGQAYQQWDSASDFYAGTLVQISTFTQGYLGKLTVPFTNITNWSWESGPSNWTLSGSAAIKNSTDLDIGGLVIGTTIQTAVSGDTHLMTMDNNSVTTGRAGFTMTLQNIDGASLFSKTVYLDQNYDEDMTLVVDTIPLAGITGPVRLVATEYWGTGSFTSAYFPAEVVPSGQLNYAYGLAIQRVYYPGFPPGRVQYQYNKVHVDLTNLATLVPKVFIATSAGSWESQDIQATGLTQWRLFDTVSDSKLETLGFQVKTAATQGGLAAASYYTITPGAVVSGTTNTWLKVKASMQTSLNYVTPYVDRVVANWVTGSLQKSGVVAFPYKSRYWMSVSTSATTPYNNLTMVESKSPLGSYTMFDLPITAMTLWNNQLYAGIGGTDKIGLMDTGSTDDGATITSYWDSRDEIYTSPVVYKSINRMIVDYRRLPDNNNLQIGLSNNLGTQFSYKTLDTGTFTLPRNTKIINMDANRTLQFRSRILNNTPGVGFSVLGVHTFGSESNFQGN